MTIELSHTVRVNDPSDPAIAVLTRDDVWEGLVMKVDNALPFVPQMEKCDVVERQENFIVRDVRFGGDELREEVTLTPKSTVEFRRVQGRVLGLIKNKIVTAPNGDLELEFSFALDIADIEAGSQEERDYEANMRDSYIGAVDATLGAVRKIVAQRDNNNSRGSTT